MFADGGYLGSKPYAASGAYINKMSDYCRGCQYDVKEKNGPNACPFNYLYWDFLQRNRSQLSHNQRLRMIYSTLSKMDPDRVEAIDRDSRHFLEALGENDQTLARFEGVLSEYGLNKMALVFKNNDLIIRKRLLEELIASEKWRSVYLSMDPNKGEGVTIFVSQDVVEKHQLKIVSVGELRSRF